MKESPFYQQARNNMAPGIICSNGMLGSDRRPLAEIIEADAAALKRLKVSCAIIASTMTEFLTAGNKGLGEFITFRDHFEVRVNSVRGFLRCPFGERGMIRKENVTVRNLLLDREISFSALSIHLIAEHGFFQGRGAPFRLEPADVDRILEIR